SPKEEEKGSPKEEEKGSPKEEEKGSPKEEEKGSPKEEEKGSPKEEEKGSPKEEEKGSPKEEEKGSPKEEEKGSPKEEEKGSPKEEEKGSPKEEEKGSPKEEEKDKNDPSNDMFIRREMSSNAPENPPSSTQITYEDNARDLGYIINRIKFGSVTETNTEGKPENIASRLVKEMNLSSLQVSNASHYSAYDKKGMEFNGLDAEINNEALDEFRMLVNDLKNGSDIQISKKETGNPLELKANKDALVALAGELLENAKAEEAREGNSNITEAEIVAQFQAILDAAYDEANLSEVTPEIKTEKPETSKKGKKK
ncbi:MAG: hypothetical protein SFT90_04305, partial [Rickettsiales bacterium]|nr:hypothetical protein [Rickettsiales bacterium]